MNFRMNISVFYGSMVVNGEENHTETQDPVVPVF